MKLEVGPDAVATVEAWKAKSGKKTKKEAAEELISLGWAQVVGPEVALPVTRMVQDALESVASADRFYREEEMHRFLDAMEGYAADQRSLVAAMALLAFGDDGCGSIDDAFELDR